MISTTHLLNLGVNLVMPYTLLNLYMIQRLLVEESRNERTVSPIPIV